jgi:hypothetical protein
VNEGRYVYPHKPDLECSWIGLDDVAKFMIAALDRIPIGMETFADWSKRQEWRMTNKPRPPAG